MRLITREAARRLDQCAVELAGMPSALLMENAGRGAADCLESLGIAGPVLICCGRGNNGGDGLVIARHLDLRGYSVRVVLFAEHAELRGDAALNLHILEHSNVPILLASQVQLDAECRRARWIVDALLGTGARGETRPPLDRAIQCMNAAGVPILAVDLPSGLDCDTGQAARDTIRAAHTVTFVAAKPGFFQVDGPAHVGQVHVADIGAPRSLVEQILASI